MDALKPQKIVLSGREAREKILKGVNKIGDIIKLTLGPGARKALIDMTDKPFIVDDGAITAKKIWLDDECEDLVAKALTNACEKTNQKVGDGTTTTTVLAQKLINDGFKKLGGELALLNSISPIELEKEITSIGNEILLELKKLAKPISTKEDLIKVASVASDSKEIGKIIGDIFDRVGLDGSVAVEDNFVNSLIETEIVNGLAIDKGYASDFMASGDRGEAIMENCYVLVHRGRMRLEDFQFINKICTDLLNQRGQKQLYILTNNCDPNLVRVFVNTRLQGAFTVLVTKTEATNQQEMEDFATVLGATIYEYDKGMKLEDININDLGRCDKVIVNKDKTIILGGKGDIVKVSERLNEVKELLSKESDDYQQKRLKKRIAQLAGGIGLIKVGAPTDSERNQVREKVIDAVNATRASMEEGVVKGGGLALKEIAEKLPNSIMTDVIKEPYKIIQQNYGGNLEITDEIVDPVKVTRTALENACSVAKKLLLTDIIVAYKNENNHCCNLGKKDDKLTDFEKYDKQLQERGVKL